MKIPNHKSQITKNGFTLVEMLVVMVVFGVVGSIAAAILVTSLRTSSKTSIVTNVKQSGNFSIEQMTKILREARLLKSACGTNKVPITTNSLNVVTNDGLLINLSCHNCDASTGVCTGATGDPSTISSNSASLIDTTNLNLVSCQFTCTQDSLSDYPIISVQFSLTNISSSKLPENQAGASAVSFGTSVSMRNINR